jgi:hypothetical protein
VLCRGGKIAEKPVRPSMEKHNAGKLVGLLVGCLVVAVMLFMMVAVLSGLLSGQQ